MADAFTDRRPPYNEEAEQAVLGACFLDEAALAIASRRIDERSFYRDAHRRIWRALVRMREAGTKLDLLLVADDLAKHGELEAAGGKEYLATLIDAVPTAANVSYHANVVRGDAHLRRIIEQATEAVTAAMERRTSAAEIAQAITVNLLPLSVDSASHAGYQRADPWVVIDRIEQRMRGEVGLTYPSGFAALDAHTLGHSPGDLVVIGAVAKAGKSVLAHHVVLHHVLTGHAAAIVSAELQAHQVVERMMNSLAQVPVRATRTGRLTDAEIARLSEAAAQIAKARLFIDDAQTPSWDDVRSRAIALKAEHPDVTMMVVDFLQLVRYEMRGRRGDEELKELSYGLKGLAKQLGVVMYVPCQLNYKDIEKRPDKRPELMDLQGSSGPAQAADLVILLFREQMYVPHALPTLELIVPAGGTRNTAAFNVSLYWRGDEMRIANDPTDAPVPPRQTFLFTPSA